MKNNVKNFQAKQNRQNSEKDQALTSKNNSFFEIVFERIKQFNEQDKETISGILFLSIFILCLVFLKSLVNVFLAYSHFCETLFN